MRHGFLATVLSVLAVAGRAAHGQCPPPRAELPPVSLAFAPDVLDDGGVQFVYHVPPGSTRILLLFHGTGGNASGWFARAERIRFVQEAVERGWAVAALDSTNRVDKQWSPLPPAINPDIARVQARLADLVALGLLEPDAAIVAAGHSNGSGFVSRLSQAVLLRAMLISGAKGIDAVFTDGTPPPTLFETGRYDPLAQPFEVATNAAVMSARGLPYRYTVLEPAPVTAGAFTRIPGVSAALSAEIRDALAGGGLLDACGLQTAAPLGSGWQALLPAAALPFRPDIEDQLNLLFAWHEFSATSSTAQLDFFDFPGCGQEPGRFCTRSTAPAKVKLVLKDRTPSTKDSVAWTWRKGGATALDAFGDPLAGTDHGLCIWNGAGTLVLRSMAPAGGACGNKACWKATGTKGFAYADPSLTPEGLRSLKLRAGDAGEAIVKARGKGEPLAMPGLPLGLPFVAQVTSADGRNCWQARYADPARVKRNDTEQVVATASSPSAAFVD